MSRHDSLLRIRHMRDHAAEAIDLLEDKSFEDFSQDRILQLALARLIGIIGEAASRVTTDFRRQHPDVPWQDASSMRHKLIHDYEYVDLRVVYDTVQSDLPPLVTQLEEIVT